MKLTEYQIKQIINSFLSEAYKGQIGGKLKQNPETGEWEREEGPITFDTDDQSDIARAIQQAGTGKYRGSVPKTAPAKQKKGVAKLYQSKVFKKQASWMFGERALPDSNVYIVPVAGSNREATELLFGYSVRRIEDRTVGAVTRGLSDQEKTIAKERGAHEELQRHMIFDIDGKGIDILTNLGLNIQEMSAINKEKDIIFVPITSGTARSFTGTPHLIIHALMDPGLSNTKTDRFLNGAADNFYTYVAGKIGEYIEEKYKYEHYGVQSRYIDAINHHLGTTKAFRDGKVTTSQDAWAEMMTQEFTMQVAKTKNRTPKGPGLSFNPEIIKKLPSEIVVNLFYFRKVLRAYMDAYRKFLQGKVVIINQF